MKKLSMYVTLIFCITQSLTATKILVDKIIARVNNQTITLSLTEEPNIFKGVQPSSIKELIDEELLCQRAKIMHGVASEADIERSLSSFKIMNNLTHLSDEELNDELRKIGLSLSLYKQQTGRMLTAGRTQYFAVDHKIVITSQEVETYWKNNPEYQEDEYHLKSTTLDARTKKLSSDMLKKKASWQDLGWFFKADLSEEASVALSLKEGEISAPFENNGSQQVIMLVAKKPYHTKTLDERYTEVEKILREEKRDRLSALFTQELRNEALIHYP